MRAASYCVCGRMSGHIHSQKEPSSLYPYLAGLGITTGIGMGLGVIASSTTFYHTLSKDFIADVERAAKSLVAL